jgi:lysozyme
LDSKLEECIIEHEGIKKSVYKDSEGYDTIGIGFLCDARLNAGLSVDECMMIFRSRLSTIKNQLNIYDWYKNQDEVRQGVLIELVYNLGLGGLLEFKKFLDAMLNKQPGLACKELTDSKWATQVSKTRLNSILNRLRIGRYS